MTIPAFRALPSVDRLLADARVAALCASYGRDRVVEQVRRTLDEVRRGIAQGAAAPDIDGLIDEVVMAAQRSWQPGLRRVINATGVVIHTNLGRAPLSREALRAMT